jgi:Bacterial inner membrane protein
LSIVATEDTGYLLVRQAGGNAKMILMHLEVIGQIFIFVAAAMTIVSWQFKHKDNVLIVLFGAGLFWVAGYFCLGDYAPVFGTSISTSLVILGRLTPRHIKMASLVGGLLYIVAMLVFWWLEGGIKTPITDLSASGGALLYIYAMHLPNEAFRKATGLSLIFWLTNNIAAGAWGGVISNLVESGSMLLGYMRARKDFAVAPAVDGYQLQIDTKV